MNLNCSVTILSASSVRTLVHCVVKYSRPPDLKSSSNVSLPFAWITGPRKRTQLGQLVISLPLILISLSMVITTAG